MQASPVRSSLPPAHDVAARYAADFTAIGARVSTPTPTVVNLMFDSPIDEFRAGTLLRDTINGAQITLSHDGPELPIPRFTRDGAMRQALEMASLLPRVNSVGIGMAPQGTTTLAFTTETAADLTHSSGLVREQVLGAPVDFEVTGAIFPQQSF